MEAIATSVPLGFYFQPKDEDLIQYLKNKIEGVPVDPMIIKEFDVYSTEPWNLPHDQFPYQREETEMYFFCERKHSGNGSRVKRTAGSGHWHGYGSNKPIKVSSGEVVGHKTTNLSFMTAQRDISHWVMDEYRLPSEEQTVLCKIRLSARGKNKLKRKLADAVLQNSPSPMRRRTASPTLSLLLPSAAVSEIQSQVSTLMLQEPQASTAEVFYQPEHGPIYEKLVLEMKKLRHRQLVSSMLQQQQQEAFAASRYQLPQDQLGLRYNSSNYENPNSVLYQYQQQQQRKETWDALMDQFLEKELR